MNLTERNYTSDLEDNWAVVAEGIQTILRREGYPQPYEALKTLTRGQEKISEASIKRFIHSLEVDDAISKNYWPLPLSTMLE